MIYFFGGDMIYDIISPKKCDIPINLRDKNILNIE